MSQVVLPAFSASSAVASSVPVFQCSSDPGSIYTTHEAKHKRASRRLVRHQSVKGRSGSGRAARCPSRLGLATWSLLQPTVLCLLLRPESLPSRTSPPAYPTVQGAQAQPPENPPPRPSRTTWSSSDSLKGFRRRMLSSLMSCGEGQRASAERMHHNPIRAIPSQKQGPTSFLPNYQHPLSLALLHIQ